jgi:polyisoprenoid-binding protein YceI
MQRSNRTRFVGLLVTMLALVASLPALAADDVYSIDPSHSNVQFRVRHLMSKVTGSYTKFSGEIRLDRANLAKGSVTLDIDAASIDTANEKRDAHLKSADFFDVEKNPKLTFKSTKVTADPKDPNKLTVVGDLTMHGVTKPVTLDVAVQGFMKDPWGNERAGFDVSGKLNRKDFGVVWNKTLDEGGTLLGDDVEILIAIEAVKEVPQAPEAKKAEEVKKG